MGEQAASRDPSKRDRQTGEIVELRLAARELPHRFLHARDPFGPRRRVRPETGCRRGGPPEFARVGVDRFGEIALEKALMSGTIALLIRAQHQEFAPSTRFESDNSLSTNDLGDQKVIG